MRLERLYVKKNITQAITQQSISPDSKRIAVISYDNLIVYDTLSGSELFTAHCDHDMSPQFNQAGTMLATVGYDTLALWDAQSGEVLRTVKLPHIIVNDFKFFPNGDKLAFVLNRNSVWIYDISHDRLERISRFRKSYNYRNLLISGDGKELIVIFDNWFRVFRTDDFSICDGQWVTITIGSASLSDNGDFLLLSSSGIGLVFRHLPQSRFDNDGRYYYDAGINLAPIFMPASNNVLFIINHVATIKDIVTNDSRDEIYEFSDSIACIAFANCGEILFTWSYYNNLLTAWLVVDHEPFV